MTLKKVLKTVLYVFVSLIILLVTTVWYYYPGASEVEKIEQVGFIYKNDVIIVSAMVSDSGPFNFVLDTGTDPSVIDINLSKELSIYQYSLGKEDVGENAPIEIVIPLPMKLKVGGLPTARKMFLGIDIKEMSSEMGMPIHGILGYNFIKDNIVQINYHEQILTFYPQGLSPYQGNEANVKKLGLSFIDQGKLPRIEVLNVKGKPVNATIDTGSNQGLTLFRACVDYLDLTDELENARKVESLGYGGTHTTNMIEGLTLAIDDWILPHTPINLDLESEKAKVGLDVRGGNIGNKVLKNYHLTLDYKNNTVWFERNGF